MPDLTEEFGAGLELETQASGTDPFVDEFRTIFTELPADATREDLQQYVADFEAKADRAKDLEDRARRAEAKLAEHLAAQSAAPAASAAAEQAAAVQTEWKRRYEAAQAVDPSLQRYLNDAFVQVDNAGYYSPKADTPYDAHVERACNQMNANLQRDQRVIRDFVFDPDDFIEKGLAESPTLRLLRERQEAYEKRFAEYDKQIAERLAPLQQTTEEVQRQQFLNKNADVLWDAKSGKDGDWTPVGKAFNNLIAPEKDGGGGLSMDRALQIAKSTMANLVPAPVVEKTPAKPKRSLMERVQERYQNSGVRPREVGPNQRFEQPFAREPGSLAELREQVLASRNN